MKDTHPTKTELNEDTGASEPVLTNRHNHSDRWEWDPDWTPEDQADLEHMQAEARLEDR